MSATRSKADAQKTGRKASVLAESAVPVEEVEARGQGAISAALLQNMLDSLSTDICTKIDGLSASLRAEISAVRQELFNSITPLQQSLVSHSETLRELERSSTDHATQLTELQSTVAKLTAQAKHLEDKSEDLEARSRRNNVRISGIPEGSEGTQPTNFIAELLQKLLNLEEKPLLDRAHRALREKPKDGAPPRPFIARVHFFHIRTDILQRAGKASPLRYEGKSVFISPDYTASVAKRRAAFGNVKRQLRTISGAKFGLRYPATLWISLQNGQSRSFDNAQDATSFVNDSLKKSSPVT